jgi:GNAT superfamily N-acetyltransferase
MSDPTEDPPSPPPSEGVVTAGGGAASARRCRLRDFVADDAVCVGRWLQQSTLHYVAVRSWLPRVLSDDRIVARVADRCDSFGARQICGFLRLDLAPDRSAEVTVLVAPTLRRRGVGRQLLAEADRIAKARGLQRVVAWVEGPNAASLALFAAAGYEPAHAADGPVTMGRFQRFERAVRDRGTQPLEIIP